MPHKPSFARKFCLVKNFPTSRFTNSLWKWLRHRRIFWRFALKTAFGSGVFFAVPNKTAMPPHLSLRFLKGLIETLAKTTNISIRQIKIYLFSIFFFAVAYYRFIKYNYVDCVLITINRHIYVSIQMKGRFLP